MNIHQRINEIRKKVAYLRKQKKVDGAGYLTVTHDQVTGELREYFIEFGVIVEPPEIVSSKMVETGTVSGKGVPFMRYEAVYKIDFVNMDEPKDRITRNIEAHAIDQGDKAPGKAMSYATKYAMLKLFSIETGEDEEERKDVKAVTPNAGAMDNVPKERHEFVHRIASTIIDCFEADVPPEGYKSYKEVTDNMEKLAVWSLLDSKIRRELKKMDEQARKAV